MIGFVNFEFDEYHLLFVLPIPKINTKKYSKGNSYLELSRISVRYKGVSI
jgi:hypothetical protein